MFRLLLASTVATILVASSPLASLAHPGHDHKVMGVITAINGTSITLKANDGKERTFEITEATKLTRGKQKGAAADLKVGMRLVVNVGDGEEPLKAKQVQYSGVRAGS